MSEEPPKTLALATQRTVPLEPGETRREHDLLGEADAALEQVEYQQSLAPLLEKLPQRERTIIMLRFFKNMTQSQIAAEIGISQMHVSRLLSRTLEQLRNSLEVD